MKTDISLKYAFERLGDSLRRMTRDSHATILAAEPLELVELARRLDMVWRLSKHGRVFYRDIEFNASGRRALRQAAFYNLMASAQLGAPVLTTIIQLGPPRLKARETYEIKLGPRVIHRWSFDAVNLFELPAEDALRLRSPGYLALLPLMKGASPERVKAAFGVLQHLEPTAQVADARVILLNLAQQRYPESGLRGLVTKEQLMQSTLFDEFRAEGRLGAERDLCLEMLREFHPSLVSAATPVVEACSDTAVLREWILLAPKKSSAAELARLMKLPLPRTRRAARGRPR